MEESHSLMSSYFHLHPPWSHIRKLSENLEAVSELEKKLPRSKFTGTTVCTDIPQAETGNGVVRSSRVGIDELRVIRVPIVLRLTRVDSPATDTGC
jgi:hypothetical protein